MEIGVIYFIIFIFLFGKSLRVVKVSESLVIERLGKYKKTATAGLNFIWPFIERVRAKVDLREQTLEINPQIFMTKDNVALKIDTVVFYQIIDPKSSVYEVQNLSSSIKYLTQTTMRDVIGKMELTTALTSRDAINSELRQTLDEATDKWGCKVTRVEIKNIDPPKDIREKLKKSSSNFNSNNAPTYQYSTFFKQTVQPGDVVRILKVDGSNITIEKINENY